MFDEVKFILYLIFHNATKIKVATTDKKRKSNYSHKTFKLKINVEYQYTLISSTDIEFTKPT
jgi:hypothetical protein